MATLISTPSDTSPVTRNLWVAGGLAVFFLVLGAQYTGKVLDPERDTRSAFLRWRNQVLDLVAGKNIWESHNYPNPPIMALALSPLMHLPPLIGALTWFYLKVGMALLALHWCFRMVEASGRPFPAWGKALAIGLSLRPIAGDLTHGNVNIFILFLVTAALYAFSRRRDSIAGLILALAIACKVTPALFVPYFAWKRSWKVLIACGLGLALFFWLIPGLILGMDANTEYLNEWIENMVLPYARGQIWTEHENQSLAGVLFRLLTESPSFTTYVYKGKAPTEYHNLLSLPPAVLPLILKGCMAIFAGIVVWVCRAPICDRRGWRLTAEFALLALGMLIFSERTWKHHCVMLLLPFATVAYYLSTVPRNRTLIVSCLTAAVLLILLTGTGLSPELDRAGKLAQTYGAYLWAHLLLCGLLVTLLWRENRTGPATEQAEVAYWRTSLANLEPSGPARATAAAPCEAVRDGAGHSF